MVYVILPVEDAQLIFTTDELSHLRHNSANTEVIVHEQILLDKRSQLGLATLSTNDDGTIQWTYPTYNYNTPALNDLLNSSDWTTIDE